MNALRILGSKLSVLTGARNLNNFLGANNFSSLLGVPLSNKDSLLNAVSEPFFRTRLNLIPVSGSWIQKCGMKVKGKLKLRCKHCYYAGIEGVLHVFCDMYPRHKQRALTKRKKKYNWLLTHACQSKYRPY